MNGIDPDSNQDSGVHVNAALVLSTIVIEMHDQ